MFGTVTCFFKQGDVDVTFHITHDTRIPVPVPGPAKPASVVDAKDLLLWDASLDGASSSVDSSVGGPDDEKCQVAAALGLRRQSLGGERIVIDERVFVQVLQLGRPEVDELGDIVPAKALVSLGVVFLLQVFGGSCHDYNGLWGFGW